MPTLQPQMLRALWAYRGLILGSIKREFQAKYQNSVLGAAWTVLNPLAMIIVYTVIFAQVMRNRLPGSDTTFAYSIYLCAGVLTWQLFSDIVSRAQSMFFEHATLLKKLSFPRMCLPVIVVGNALVNFGIVFGLFTAFLMISGNFPGIVFVSMVPLLVVQLLFATGLGVTLGVLNVFFRDVGQLFAIVMQFWFWLTPIVYPATAVPQYVRRWLDLNPMTGLVTSYQSVLVLGQWPDWSRVVPAAVLAVLLCVLALHLFRRQAGDIVDEL